MNSKLKNADTDFLFDCVLSLKTREECYDFFEDLCTVTELKAISQRIVVASLRMALGCSRMNVFGYYVLEGILLLVSAAIPAVFVCANMQMADLTVHTLMEPAWGRFLLCFVSAMLLLGIIILLGIYFPARKAMRIEPADALHNE